MSFRRLLNDTVTVHTRSGITADAEGNPTPAYTTTDWPARVEPNDATEETGGQLVATLLLNVYLPSEASVGAHDHITYDGNRYEIVGPPIMRRTPRGDHHQVLRLRQTEI